MIDFSADSEMEELSGKEEPTQTNSESGTPILDNFSRDLTAIAGKYDLSKEIKKALEEATPTKTETL